jgi:sterol desaturase/sphingolipid hydroxylase (fatty acid hydroxylase superfamily)
VTIDERTFQLVRAIAVAFIFGASLCLEWAWPHERHPTPRRRNLTLWAINVIVIGVLCGACICTASRWAEGAGVGLFNVLATPRWASVPTTLLALDALSYAWHRANHRIPLLWRFHQIHHLDPTPNCSTALRFHPGELLLSLPVRLAAVTALGAPIESIVAFEVLFGWANVLEHANFDVHPVLEQSIARVFVTPALHRLHHSSERGELDTNFGTVFAFWDRLGLTYRRSSSALHFIAGVPGRTSAPEPTMLQLLGEPLASSKVA